MGFAQDKKYILEALTTGVFSHEVRDAKALKNLLACDPNFTKEEAFDIVKATRGNQAQGDTHHQDQQQLVWVLKPVCHNRRRYVKCYIDRQTEWVQFISFHPAEDQ